MENKQSYITEVDILDEAKENFLTYSEEVLTDRAIPAAEDGLLSAQRKIIWTMEDYLKMDSKGKTKKCNALVGSTLATSYFHGDASCYGVLSKMAQEYLMRYPLLKGQGALGTQADNDKVAASRYTEAKPSIFADLMMNDFKKDVVPLKETYNGEFMEPVVLPSLFPNAICNGRQAIGISMSHNSAPHNLTEVCNAIIAMIEKGDLTIDEILEYIPGPDFPLKNTVLNSKDVRAAFATGKSSVSLKIRGEYEIQGNKIIFTTIPYRTYRNKIKEQIEKNIDELSKVIDDFDDESSVGQNRLIFYTSTPDVALNKLFALTDLQSSISYNMNYIVNGTPKMCSMNDLLHAYIDHQEQVLINATTFDREKAVARAHILRGLIAAVDKIDEVIALIKSASDRASARIALINFLSIDEEQANAILDMKLGKLTRIDKQELVNELEEKEQFIANCDLILNDKVIRNNKLIEMVANLRDKYGDERRTTLLNVEITKEKKEKPEVIPEDCVVVVTQSGLVKRIPAKSFKTAKRNTVGVKTGDDIVSYSTKTNTVDTLMVFSDIGKMYRIGVDDIPEGTNVSRGTSLRLLAKMGDTERPMAYSSLTNGASAGFIFFATKNGIVKKVPMSEYDSMKRTGILAIKLKEGDSLASVTFVEQEPMMLVTHNGQVIVFNTKDMPISSRIAQGVKGISIADDDYVIAALPISGNSHLTVVTESGLGKRVPITEFTTQGRGGKGVLCSKTPVAGAVLTNDDDLLLVCGDRSSVALEVKTLSELGRTSAGVTTIKNNAKVVSIARI